MKRQASVIAAIFQDPSLLKKGEEFANDAAGVTEEAMGVALDTIDVKLGKLKNEAQTFWQELINSKGLKTLIDGLSNALGIINKMVSASGNILGGNGTAGLIGMIAGSGQSLFAKARHGANSSGGLMSFTGNGSYFAGIKLNRSEGSKYSDIMDKNGLIYSSSDMAAIDKLYKAFKKAKNGAEDLDDIAKKAGVDIKTLSTNGNALANSMQTSASSVDSLIKQSKALSTTTSATGEAFKSFGRVMLSSLASGAISAVFSLATSALINWYNDYVNRLDDAIDKSNEFTQTIQQQTSQYSDNESQIESLRDEYESLSQGVDDNGKNVSLTTDQYERYKAIVAQIIELAPDLAKGYSDENGYLVDRNSLIDDAIAKQKEYNKEAQQARFTSTGFATEVNGALASAQQAGQEAVKSGTSWWDRIYSNSPEARKYTDNHQPVNLYPKAQQNFVDNLKKLYGMSSQSSEETLDEYLSRSFGISGDTVDNIEKISKEMDRITKDLRPTDEDTKAFDKLSTKLNESAEKWISEAEAVDDTNKQIQDNFSSYVENMVDGYDKLTDAQKKAIKNSIGKLTYADVSNGTQEEMQEDILNGTWKADDTKRNNLQKKYSDEVALLSSKQVQNAFSKYSKIDMNLDYSSYEKQYKENMDKLKQVLQNAAANSDIELQPADIEQLVQFTPVDEDGNDLKADPEAMVDQLKKTLSNGEKYIDSLTLDQINVIYPVVAEFANEHPNTKISVDQLSEMLSLQVRVNELQNKSAKSYSDLKTEVDSFVSSLQALNEITANNQIITTDMFAALQNAGASISDLDEAVQEFGTDEDGNTTYIVKNIDKLKELTKAAAKAGSSDLADNIDVQRRRYAELVDQLDDAVKSNYDLVNSNQTLTDAQKDNVSAIQDQLDQTESLIEEYAALQEQMSSVSKAYSDFQKAQEYDTRTDFSSEAVEMIQEIVDDLYTGAYGKEAFKTAVKSIIPDSVYKNKSSVNDQAQAIGKYLDYLTKQNYFKLDEDNKITGLNVDTFRQKALKNNVLEGTEDNYGRNYDVSTEKAAEKLKLSETMLHAFDSDLAKYSESGREMFADTGDAFQDQLYRAEQEVNDAENNLQDAMNRGVTELQPYKQAVDDVKEKNKDVFDQARKDVTDYIDAMDQLNDIDLNGGTEGQKKRLEDQLNKKPTQLEVQLVDDNIDDELAILQGNAKDKKIKLYAEVFGVDESQVSDENLNEWVPKRIAQDQHIKDSASKHLDDESNAAKTELETMTQSLGDASTAVENNTSGLDNNTKALNDLAAALSGLSVPDGTSSGIASGLSEVEANATNKTKIDADTSDANKKIDETQKNANAFYKKVNDSVATVKVDDDSALTKINGIQDAFKSVKEWFKNNPLSVALDPKAYSDSMNAVLQKSVQSGSDNTHRRVSGQQKANGGVSSGGKTLVGEEGRELVVDRYGGTFSTVGDNGAEFVNLPKDAIVFNHAQTEQLLKNGHTSRGKALANGNAKSGKYDYSGYSDLWSMSKADLIKQLAQVYAEAQDFDSQNPGFTSTTGRTRYGNVDVSNRQALVWNKQNQKKYADNDYAYDWETGKPLTGYSTLLGGSTEIDGYEIAFTPVVENPGQADPTLLNEDTVYEYIDSLIRQLNQKYGDQQWSIDKLYAADHKGIQWDVPPYSGQLIHDIIASATLWQKEGDDLASIYTGEAMHYSGQMWDAVNVLNQKYGQRIGSEALAKLAKNDARKKKSGKAKANGGVSGGDAKALVGELGQELVVDPNTGKYYTVGDDGAEFVSLPKGAIVFNHAQTAQLLKSGHADSRGTALVSGNAYDTEVTKPVETYVQPSGRNGGKPKTYNAIAAASTEEATKAAKSAAKAVSDAGKKAADDWVTAFKDAADKLRDQYKTGKLDATEYFDALTKLYQKYYDGYGKKSDENMKKLKEAWTSIYSSESSDLEDKKSNGEITEREYLDRLRNLYKLFYSDLKNYGSEYVDAQKAFAQKAKSAYQSVLQAGASVVGYQIKQLQSQMDGAVNALQKQKDTADRSYEMQMRPLNAEIKRYEKLEKALNKQIKAKNKEQTAIEKVIDAKNKEISAIQEASQARQADIDLQKAQYELNRAENQRTQYTYTSDKGFVYRSNPTDVKEAKENLQEKQESSRVQQITNEINALNEEKEALQDEIDKIQEVIDGYEEHVDAIQEQIDAIQELKDATDQYYDDAIYNIQQQYQTQIDALQKIQDMWDQMGELFDLSESLQLLQSFGLTVGDITGNAGTSIDLIKGKLADVLAYLYQNNTAAQDVWSTLLGIDLSKITPNIDNFALGIRDVANYASAANGNVQNLNQDLSSMQLSGAAAQTGLSNATSATGDFVNAASSTSPQDLANTMAQLSGTDLSGFNGAIGAIAANASSMDTLNAALTQTLTLMQTLGGQDTFGAIYNQFVAFVTNFEALATQFQQDMTALFGSGQTAGNDQNSKSAGWFDGFVQQVEDMNERTSAALQNQIDQWTQFQQLMVGVLGVDGNGGQGGEGNDQQQQQGGGSGGTASADSIIGSLTLAATDMNEAFQQWEETLDDFITGDGGFNDFTNKVMTLITAMADKIKEQCDAAIGYIDNMVNKIIAANNTLAGMGYSPTTIPGGPANAAGAPTGLKHDENRALVGELGPETVVRDGKYRVVGQRGPEFVSLKRGDIVLDHKRTAKLFKGGAAYADGYGSLIPVDQPSFMKQLAAMMPNLSSNIKQMIPSVKPRSFEGTGRAAKLAAADGTSIVINDLHVSLPNFNSDKADDLIQDLSSMTLKAVQRYNRH